jgi:hypothetical protein
MNFELCLQSESEEETLTSARPAKDPELTPTKATLEASLAGHPANTFSHWTNSKSLILLTSPIG